MAVRRVKIENSVLSSGGSVVNSRGRSERTRVCANCDEPVIYAEKGEDEKWRCNSCVKREQNKQHEVSRTRQQDDHDLYEAYKNHR